MFFAVRLDTCHCPTWNPTWQCTMGLWYYVSRHDHVSTASSRPGETHCHSQSSVMATWHTSVVDGTDITTAYSTRQDMCEATLYSITYHPNSCLTACFDYPASDVGKNRRGCFLKPEYDMSAGDNANCCRGRLSIGNMQGHTPWVLLWAHRRVLLRNSRETHQW